MKEDAWRQTSSEILSEIKAWRQAHPHASFVEMEAVIHERMMRLEAQVLQDAALASPKCAWGNEATTAPATCPHCGVPLQARGSHTRRLQGNGGQAITLERTYGTCPDCGEGFFPPR